MCISNKVFVCMSLSSIESRISMFHPKLENTYSVGQNVSCFHFGQKVSGGELKLILEVNLQQGVVVTNIILCTCR